MSAAIGDGPTVSHPTDVRVSHPADVPELDEHPPALGVHGVGDLRPALLMAVGEQAGSVAVGTVGRPSTAVASLMIRPAVARCA